MPNRNTQLFIFLMLALVGIGYLSFDNSLHIGVQKKQSDIRENADYYLIDTNITQYDQSGFLDYTLSSMAVTHYPFNDTTLLQNPRVESFSNPEKPMIAQAEHGKLLPGGQDVELWDDVIMTQTDLRDNNTVRMDTDFITIYPEQGLAVTDRPVLITDNAGETRAVGMEAFYKESLVKLKSRVRGVHQPQK